MKPRWNKLLLVSSILVLAGGNAFGTPEQIKERAKSLRDQNNARQGVPPAGAPAGPGAPAATPAPVIAQPSKPTSRDQSIARLKADLALVHKKNAADADLKQRFAVDLKDAAQGKGQPSIETATKFGNGLLEALAPKSVTAGNDARLVQDIVISLNSAGLSVTRTGEIADQFKATLEKSGVSAEAASSIAADLRELAAEVQKAGAK